MPICSLYGYAVVMMQLVIWPLWGAALGVFGSGSAWPDLVIAVIMAGLGLSAANQVTKKALTEMTN